MTLADDWIASPEAEQFDIQIAKYDCLATQAHVLMLKKQGIMSEQDTGKALAALLEIYELCSRGEFRYQPGYGAQLTLEKMVVDRVGPEVGYQVHTGRSRNDQVMTAQRLCVRAEVLGLMPELAGLIRGLLDLAAREMETIMPGYTHMQPARPTTVAQWAGSYAEMLLEDMSRLRDTYVGNDKSPLGVAESHGTTWSLDRDYVRELLGFSSLSYLPLATISSRGESEADLLSALSFVALHLSKLAQDLLLFTSFEYGYAALGKAQAERMGRLTGSSVMPQKRNPDVLELLRAQASEIYSYLFHALEVLKGLPSGYNRDSRDTKGPALRGIGRTRESLVQARQAVEGLEWNRTAMLQAVIDNHSMTTDLAEYLAQVYKIPYREMHGIVGRVVARVIESGNRVCDVSPEELKEEACKAGYQMAVTPEQLQEGCDPAQAIQRRRNTGGAARPQMEEWLQQANAQLSLLESWSEQQAQKVASCEQRIHTLSAG